MCGICGVVSVDHQAPFEVLLALNEMRNRGEASWGGFFERPNRDGKDHRFLRKVGYVRDRCFNRPVWEEFIEHRLSDSPLELIAEGLLDICRGRYGVRRMKGSVGRAFGNYRGNVISRMPGKVASGHVRYRTRSTNERRNWMPIQDTQFGTGISISLNGDNPNYGTDRERLERKGFRFRTENDAELILSFFSKRYSMLSDLQPFQRVKQAVRETDEEIQAAFSYVLQIPGEGLVFHRDPKGIRPLWVGSKRNEQGIGVVRALEGVIGV
ncbi:hypothetical protein CMO92_00185 [Candidatus Woesearchaeota archaeon]|nr:hypothetical protein [Candidatus Woesearchaeota archaeon]|tara:strand:+ start:1339 stop:2142 length:804 start_codon:yes stop_codon:yes gene_type:complete